MAAKLVVSLSHMDVVALDRCVGFAARLDALGVPLSLLVAPRATTVPAGWLRERASGGDALVLHGYDHAVRHGAGRRAEFAALPAHEAGLRLTAATRELERLGLATTLFAPPRWLGSPGTLAALRSHGFALYADLSAVYSLAGAAVFRGRVLGPRHGGGLAEPLWTRAFALGVARAVRRDGLIRLAVSADDLARGGPARQAVLDAIDSALDHGARPHTYATLIRPVLSRAA
jgi:predicted deacetylase